VREDYGLATEADGVVVSRAAGETLSEAELAALQRAHAWAGILRANDYPAGLPF